MKRRKEEEGGGQEWLNTYADMITLVLTFFVLLYSISNVNITKLEQIAAAMQKKLGMEQAVSLDEVPEHIPQSEKKQAASRTALPRKAFRRWRRSSGNILRIPISMHRQAAAML